MKPMRRAGITPRMTSRAVVLLIAAMLLGEVMAGQGPVLIDTSKLGPQVGAAAPAFTGVDQFGTSRTLASAYGPNGVMLVFFRSADW
jgi:hypothetical protein